MDEFTLWAHRGASAHAPENTMSAFRAAEEAGAGGIELDVHLSRDGVPVVIHDLELERTTNGRGGVGRKTWKELESLDAGSWFSSEYAGERIPALEEVLAWADSRVRLNVEIKDSKAALAVFELLGGYPGVDALISSFDYRPLQYLRSLSVDLSLALICNRYFWRKSVKKAAELKAKSFHPRQDLVSASMVRACLNAGLKVYPYTVDGPERARDLRRKGVAGLFTNDPELLSRTFQDMGRALW